MKRILPVAIVAVLIAAGVATSLLGTMRPAQAQTFPVTLTMTGPPTAVAGQEITYRVHYQFTDRLGTAIVIGVTEGASYVSTQTTSGPDGSLEYRTERSAWWGVLASAEKTEGEIEFVVRVSSDFTGSLFGSAYVPGTGTTESNNVETRVFAPGTMPVAGGGSSVFASGPPLAAGLLALVGASLFCAGAATRKSRRSS